MNVRHLLAIVAIMVAIAGPVRASEEERVRCLEGSGGVTVAMIDCEAAAAAREDDRLNRLWRDNAGFIAGERGNAIADAQRRWIAYRDATCRAEGAVHDGSFSGVQYNACRARLTKTQADWLEAIFGLAAETSR